MSLLDLLYIYDATIDFAEDRSDASFTMILPDNLVVEEWSASFLSRRSGASKNRSPRWRASLDESCSLRDSATAWASWLTSSLAPQAPPLVEEACRGDPARRPRRHRHVDIDDRVIGKARRLAGVGVVGIFAEGESAIEHYVARRVERIGINQDRRVRRGGVGV